jgi:flagellar protein FlaG
MEIQSQSAVAAQAVVVQGNSATSVKTTASNAGQAAPAPAAAQPDRKTLEQAVRDMSEVVNVVQPPQLSFAIDDSSERVVIRVTDVSTGELIRQIPSEDALSIASSLDKLQGLLLNGQA